MSLRRAVGFLLTRRFSPRVIPRTAPARSFHSLRDLPIGDGGLRGVAAAAAAFAGVGALAVQYFRKGPDDDELAPRKQEEDIKAPHKQEEDIKAALKKEAEMKVRFENWMKRHNKKYRNEKEKNMRFEVFKESVEWIESQPPSRQKLFFPENCIADMRFEELPFSHSCIPDSYDDPDSEEYRERKFMDENENGDTVIWKPEWKPDVKKGCKPEWKPDVKKGGKQATQVSA